MRRIGFGARRAALLAVVPLTLLGSGALVWQASYAAFTASTATGANTWSTGTVGITSDQSAQVVFSGLTGLKPHASLSALSPGTTGGAYTAGGATTSGGSACIKVTYSGSLTSDVKLHATLSGDTGAGTLGGQILFTVDAVNGAGGDAANLNCSSFPTGSSYLFGTNGTTTSKIRDLPADYATSSATWAGATNGGVKWYRLSWLLPNISVANASATSVTATFTWEAQNT